MRYLFITTMVLLSGCGFHLRGSVDLPPALTEIAVLDSGSASNIAPELHNALENKGIRVVNSAPMVLRLRAEKYGKRVLSVDSVGRALEYGLSYTVRFSLKEKGSEGKADVVWLPESAVIQNRDLRFDASAVLGSANEESLLKKEMRRDAVRQIMRQLQYAKQPVSNGKQ